MIPLTLFTLTPCCRVEDGILQFSMMLLFVSGGGVKKKELKKSGNAE
jgi:hypothetical protein